MTDSSPPVTRRSRQWSSPVRSRISDFLSDNRHTELSHQDALAAAQVEHERVREAAIRVFHDHELQEIHRRQQAHEIQLKQLQQKEEERIRKEERLRAEEQRLRDLKAKTVPQLPPEPPKPISSPLSPPKTNGLFAATSTTPTSTKSFQAAASTEPSTNKQAPTPNLQQLNGTGPPQPTLSQTQTQPTPPTTLPSAPSPFASQPAPNPLLQKAPTPQTAAILSPTQPTVVDRYVTIHQNLKKLRLSLTEQAKSVPPLKNRMGDMRRAIRKSLGQIVAEKGGNRQQMQTINSILQESLNGSVPSTLVDPSDYVTDDRQPMEGALYNGQLPSLFLYLINIFAKTIINQFINECGPQPKAADPIGVIAAMVFSSVAYQWRGKTLIDILMAKLRVTCPVLFGYRGSEKTEQGRLRLGWKKDGGGWAPEQQHIERMKGLAVGYAALSLRDFSKSKNTNPWPPSKYWTTFAKIVNTPAAEISNTQCVVLRSMIDTYEERFIQFYGSAAIAALRKALVDFPKKAETKTPGTAGLQVLAQILKRDIGLEL
ncbi:GLE1-domain-containing protein [Xylariaceae sp. FL0255]|nr:GLE1-domain-containing protein [Xylariaceae sp. FL0255]